MYTRNNTAPISEIKKMPIILPRILGLSDSKWSGIFGSVSDMVGIDIHSTPGLVKVHQKLTKDSGSTVDEFCRERVSCSNGYTFWFSSTSGKIWARSSTGTWTLAYTTVAGAGSSACLGAMQFNGYIYWATQSRLHRIAIADADDTWASVSLDWQTFTVTDSSFHPMAIQDNTLFIGDGYKVASVTDASVWSSNSLDIPIEHRIKSMAPFEIDIVIGTFIATTVKRCAIIRWDCVSPSWNTWDDIDEVGVNAFIPDDNYLYAQCGRAGNLYFYNGARLEAFKRIPGSWSNVAYGEIYPSSVANFNGVPVFGFSNSPEAANTTGNPAKQGVYSFGSYSRDYSKVLDLSWVISPDVTSGIEIGAVLVSGFDLLVAWKNGSSYGVDKIDYTAKYASAYFTTMMLYQDKRDVHKMINKVYALYESLPASTGITFSYNVNHAGFVAMTSVTDTKENEVRADLSVPEIGALQIKVALTVSSNNAPTLEVPLGIDVDGIDNT